MMTFAHDEDREARISALLSKFARALTDIARGDLTESQVLRLAKDCAADWRVVNGAADAAKKEVNRG